jgi:hypothetical protein
VPGHEAAVFDAFPSTRFDDGLMAAEVLVRRGEKRRWPDRRA